MRVCDEEGKGVFGYGGKVVGSRSGVCGEEMKRKHRTGGGDVIRRRVSMHGPGMAEMPRRKPKRAYTAGRGKQLIPKAKMSAVDRSYLLAP